MRWSIALMLCASATVAAMDTSFHSEELNIKIPAADGWKKSSTKAIPFLLERNGNVVLLIGYTQPGVPENMRSAYETEMSTTTRVLTCVRAENVRVGEDAGIEVEYTIKDSNGVSGTVYATFFSHQGISYRFIGAQMNALFGIQKEYRKIRDSIQYLRNRSDWIDANIGAPRSHGLLGGLVTWKLKSPRWQESTFTRTREQDCLEAAHFQLSSGGSWISVRVSKSAGTSAEELEKLRQYLSSFYKNGQNKPAETQGRMGRVPYFEIRNSDDKFPRLMRCAAISDGELTVQVWLENLASLSDETRDDWNQLILDFGLQKLSNPEQPPAYPIDRPNSYDRKPTELNPLLKKGERWLALSARDQTLGIDPTGTRALVRSNTGAYLFIAATGERKNLVLDPAPNTLAGLAWSPDGKRVAYAITGKVCIATLDPFDVKYVKLNAEALAWGPSDDELYAVERTFEDRMNWRFNTERLVLVKISNGSTRPLLEYPLARIGCPVLSPDGKSLAFVSNQDAPRKGQLFGHVYLVKSEGTDMQRLTAELRKINGLQWSRDGKHLYALCLDHTSSSGWVYDPSPAELAVIPVAEDGDVPKVAIPIQRFWSRGDDLFAEANTAVGESGIYRIQAKDVEAATSQVVTRRATAKEAARKALDSIKQAMKKDPRKFKPTAENMAEIAQAFAEAMKETKAAQLDFTMDSIGSISSLAHDLLQAEPSENLLLLGLGAYYGETLRRAGGAEWAIKAQEWGEVQPRVSVDGNAFADCVFPFEDIEAVRAGSEDVWLVQHDYLEDRNRSARLLLVYPPSYGEEAVKKATPDSYRSAMEKVETGEALEGLEMLVKEMEKYPQNALLAREAIALSQSAGNKDLSSKLVRRAVESGSKVKEILLRYGDEMAGKEPEKAMDAYRRAMSTYGNATPLMKLGRIYQKQGKPEAAESCWRKAYFSATKTEKSEIEKLMGLAKGGEENEDADLGQLEE